MTSQCCLGATTQFSTEKGSGRNSHLVSFMCNGRCAIRCELNYRQLNEIADCQPMIIVVKQEVLSALYGKDDFLKSRS